ncbi:MAG: hypothetical protein GXX96_31185 [Planctomycetaceae bacterium]|nr:hypothetical protein [Planctomycetaceae bacterium]
MSRKPTAPSHLDTAAKTVWKRLVGEIPDQSPGTLLTLEQLCYAWSQWSTAEDDDSRLRWSRCCRQWLAELKLTPKSRKASGRQTSALLRLTQDRRSDAS